MSTIPQTLPNGAKVLKVSFDAVTHNGVVLAKLEKCQYYEYVTWIFQNGDFSTTCNGHYFGSPDCNDSIEYRAAVASFKARS